MANAEDDEPGDDIPAWFMTFSDVITLLMTFFILLLTFATTEPERFEKVTASVFGTSGATGVAGHEHDQLDRTSWSERVRPRAARIAMRGSEMPPIKKRTNQAAAGDGVQTVDEEVAAKDTMQTFRFELPIRRLVRGKDTITREGEQVAAKLAAQLRALNIHCVLEFSDKSMTDQVCALAHHLYHVQNARPGQIATADVDDVESTKVRIVIERYEHQR
jgi:flagellar motor protein MotB